MTLHTPLAYPSAARESIASSASDDGAAFASPRRAPVPPPGVAPFSAAFRHAASPAAASPETPAQVNRREWRLSGGHLQTESTVSTAEVSVAGECHTPPPTLSIGATPAIQASRPPPNRSHSHPAGSPAVSSLACSSPSNLFTTAPPLTPPASPTKSTLPSATRARSTPTPRKHQRTTSIVDGTLHVRSPTNHNQLLSFPIKIGAHVRLARGPGLGMSSPSPRPNTSGGSGGAGEADESAQATAERLFARLLRSPPALAGVQEDEDSEPDAADISATLRWVEDYSPTKRATGVARALARLSLASRSSRSLPCDRNNSLALEAKDGLFTLQTHNPGVFRKLDHATNGMSDDGLTFAAELDAFPPPPVRDATKPTAPLCFPRLAAVWLRGNE